MSKHRKYRWSRFRRLAAVAARFLTGPDLRTRYPEGVHFRG